LGIQQDFKPYASNKLKRFATGYELKQTMDRSTNHFWHAKQSQIYQTLKKLEADGLVVSHPEHQESRPDRCVYAITDSGKQAMATWLAKPVTTLEPNKQLLLLKLFFFRRTWERNPFDAVAPAALAPRAAARPVQNRVAKCHQSTWQIKS